MLNKWCPLLFEILGGILKDNLWFLARSCWTKCITFDLKASQGAIKRSPSLATWARTTERGAISFEFPRPGKTDSSVSKIFFSNAKQINQFFSSFNANGKWAIRRNQFLSELNFPWPRNKFNQFSQSYTMESWAGWSWFHMILRHRLSWISSEEFCVKYKIFE